MAKVYRTEEFDRQCNKLDDPERKRIDKIEDDLAHNQKSGKPLSYDFLREKKSEE